MDFLNSIEDPKVFTLVWSVLAIALMLGGGYAIASAARLAARAAGKDSLFQKRTFAGYIYASPWIVGFVIFVLGPALLSLYWSFTDYRIGEPVTWIGTQNYIDLFEDQRFIASLFNSFYMTLVGVPLQMLTGLGMAMLLNQKFRGRNIFRTIFYMPVLMATSTAVLFTWRLMLNPNNGVVNTIIRFINQTPLRFLTGLYVFIIELSSAVVVAIQARNWTIVQRIIDNGFPGPEHVPLWIGAEGIAFLWNKPSVVVIMMWSAGAMMLIYLAALSGVPKSLYESAMVDGANNWQRFRHITLPMIAPATFYNMVVGVISTLQIFEQSVTLVRDGGQNQSLYFVAYYLWRATFRFNQIGYGAAMSWVLLVIVLILTLAQFRLSGSWVYYEAE